MRHLIRSFAVPICLALVAGEAAGQAPACVKPPGGKIETFGIMIPRPRADAYDLVIRAFVLTGHQVTESGPATIEWSSGPESDGTGTRQSHSILANVFSAGLNTQVSLVAREFVETRSGSTTRTLSQNNTGAGFEIWCGAKAIADSLLAWSRGGR